MTISSFLGALVASETIYNDAPQEDSRDESSAVAQKESTPEIDSVDEDTEPEDVCPFPTCFTFNSFDSFDL